MGNKQFFNERLISFINDSPTAFHAVSRMSNILLENGFIRLEEKDAWQLKPNERYFTARGGSSLAVFSLAYRTQADLPETGFRVLAAHTDSPGLKLKPFPLYEEEGCQQLGTEVYGGAMLASWFDRELSVAGRVSCLDEDGKIYHLLTDFKRPVAIIPSLAVHLRPKQSEASVNPQKELVPIAGINKLDFNELLLNRLSDEHKGIRLKSILGHELFLYDAAPAVFFGFNEEFIAGRSLDNLASCFAGLEALLYVKNSLPFIGIFTDNEEVGSLSFTGASGSFLSDILRRLCPEEKDKAVASSVLLSLDNAHASHPNYPESAEPRHKVRLNRGPALKINAAKRYATDSRTGALLRDIAMKLGVPLQTFVMRSDMPCGTTIGPIMSAMTGIQAADAGIPSLAMHSVRETIGAEDTFLLFRIAEEFLKNSCEEISL